MHAAVNVPQNCDNAKTGFGDQALTATPFYRTGVAHWGMRYAGSRWEVDDYPNGYQCRWGADRCRWAALGWHADGRSPARRRVCPSCLRSLG